MSNRINLTKYGFIRCPEEDFSDDGTRFYVFKFGYLKVTKAADDNYIYLSASVIGSLSYEEYSKLPSYNTCDKLNGVNKNDASEMLEDVVNEWLNYLREYKQLAFHKEQKPFNGYVITKMNGYELIEFVGDSFSVYDNKGISRERKIYSYKEAIQTFIRYIK